MKTTPANRQHPKGTSLIEAIIAVGVLAVAVPLVFGTMAETGNSTFSAQAETRSSWIASTAMDELRLAMKGESKLLDDLKPGQSFSAGSASIAFSSEAKAVRKLSSSEYSNGVQLDPKEPIRYIATISGEESKTVVADTPPLQVKVVVEYPATARSDKRQKIEFYTVMP